MISISPPLSLGTLVQVRLSSRKPSEEQSKVALTVRQDMKVCTVKARNMVEKAEGLRVMGWCCHPSAVSSTYNALASHGVAESTDAAEFRVNQLDGK